MVRSVLHCARPIPGGVDNCLVEDVAEVFQFRAVEGFLGRAKVLAQLLEAAALLAIVPFLQIACRVVALQDVTVAILLKQLCKAFVMLLREPFAKLRQRNVFLLHFVDVVHCLGVGVWHNRGGRDAGNGHNATDDDAVGHALAAEAHFLLPLLAREDAGQNGPHDCRILFVVDALQTRVVAVRCQHHLGHVVGADGEAVELLDELLGNDGVGGDFRHHDDLEAVLAAHHIVDIGEVLTHGAGFLKGTHEGQHELQVAGTKDAACGLEGFEFPVVNVAGHAAVAQHGVGFVLFEEIAAHKVAVFVRLEVRGSVDDLLAVEGHGEEGKVLGKGLHVVLLAGTVAAGLDDVRDCLGQIAHLVHFLLETHAQADLVAQLCDIGNVVGDDRIVLAPCHMIGNVRVDFGNALGAFRIRGIALRKLVVVAHDALHVLCQILRGLEGGEMAGGVFEVFVQLVVDLAHPAVQKQDFVRVHAPVFLGHLLHLPGEPCELAHILAQIEVEDNEACLHLAGYNLG